MILTRLNSPFLLEEFPMMVVGAPERLCWIIGSKRYCKVMKPGITVPRAVMILVWISFRAASPKTLAKENSWLGAPVTSGCLGSDLVKDKVYF